MSVPFEAPSITIGEEACLKGGEAAGDYLDHIGVTDLAKLTKAQWALFCQRLVGGAFVAAIGQYQADEIPF